MSGGQDSVDEAHEIDVVPAAPEAPRTGLMLGGALAVLVIAVVGAFFATNASDGETEVDVAAPDAEVVEDDAGEGEGEDTEAEGADDTAEDASRDDAEATEADADVVDAMMSESAVDFATDAAIGFGGPTNIIHTAEGFVSVGWGPDGLAVSRSADGVEWASTPISGIPSDANMVGLAEYSGGYVTVLEIWPAYEDDDMAGPMFGPPEPPKRMLAVSADLETWTTSELPDIAVEDGGFSHVAGMATSGDTVAIQIQVEPAYVDELQVLFEAELLTEADMASFCGTRFDGPEEPIIVTTCDWEAQEDFWMEFEQKMEAAETDEERMALEEEYFGNELEPASEELFRLEPGDPTHTALLDAYMTEPEMSEPVVLSGPVGGEFTQVTLPATGFSNAMAGTDGGFVTVVNDWQNGNAVVLRSTDGVTWTETTSLGSELDVQGLVATGDLIVATGNRWSEENGSMAVWTTADLGATWAEAQLGTELYGAYGMPLAGPAGVAISLEGATEPYPEFMGPELMLVESDGYELEMNFIDDVMVLRDAAGLVIHEVAGIINEEPRDIEGVVRIEESDFSAAITFLDPATGEDLVLFTDRDFEAAFEASYEPEFSGPMNEPPRRTELWFSVDGVTWELLESFDTDWERNSWTMVAGVGDDEVLVRTETWAEPPVELWAFEEEGREPTDEELAALESWDLENNSNNVEWRRIEVG